MSEQFIVDLHEVGPNRYHVVCTCSYQGTRTAPICRADELTAAHVRAHRRRGEVTAVPEKTDGAS